MLAEGSTSHGHRSLHRSEGQGTDRSEPGKNGALADGSGRFHSGWIAVSACDVSLLLVSSEARAGVLDVFVPWSSAGWSLAGSHHLSTLVGHMGNAGFFSSLASGVGLVRSPAPNLVEGIPGC